MQAVVKTPRIEVNIKGEISPKLITVLEEEFGKDLLLAEERDEETLDILQAIGIARFKRRPLRGIISRYTERIMG